MWQKPNYHPLPPGPSQPSGFPNTSDICNGENTNGDGNTNSNTNDNTNCNTNDNNGNNGNSNPEYKF